MTVWKDAVDLAKDIYDIAKTFPKEELFALGDQLRRAAVSVSANIAEGSGSDSNKDFRNFLSIAIKSLHEVISLLAIAEKSLYISEENFRVLHDKGESLVKKLQALRNSLKL